MQRVLLVKPDASFALDVAPPVGLGYLGASIRKAGHDVRCLDNRLKGQGEDVMMQMVGDWKPTVVGFSAFSYELLKVHELAAMVRKAAPDIKIMAGGPLASADPEGALGEGVVDIAVQGEGEEVTVNFLERLERNQEWRDLAGVASWQNGAAVVNPITTFIEDLNQLPSPAWDLLDVRAYSLLPRQGFIYKHRNYFPVFTSRGCPYRCIYCHDVFGKRFRPRSTETVLNEIGELVEEYGCKEIHFIDDIFNLEKNRAGEILQGIIDNKWDLSIAYPNGLRGDILTEELVDLMKAAGTFKVSIAIESGTKRVQKFMRKNLKFENAKRSIKWLTDRRILTHAFFLVGFPTETEEEIQETIEFSKEITAHTASFFIVNPFKGTELAEIVEKRGGKATQDYRVSGYFDPEAANLAISEVDPDKLREMVSRATRDFYLKKPGRLLRILRDIPRKRQIPFLAFLWANRAFMPKAIQFERALSQTYASMLGALNKDGWSPDPSLSKGQGKTTGKRSETGYLARLRRSFLFGQ